MPSLACLWPVLWPLLLVTAVPLHAADCKVTAERTASAPLTGIERIEIDAGPGDLHVLGSAAAKTAEARARACASSEEVIAALNIEIERRDKVLHIATTAPASSVFKIFGRSPVALLDLTVTIPAGIPVTLADTSGNLEVAGVAALDLKDDSGDINVHDIEHDVNIEDKSGDLTVTSVKGNVTLRDTSDAMTVKNVGGSVEVLADNSGDITVEEIGRDFIVHAHGSGEINFSRVHRTVQIPSRRP